MYVKQMMFYLYVKTSYKDHFGQIIESAVCHEVDLKSGSIEEFIESISNEVSEILEVWVAITPESGPTIAFADGVELQAPYERLSVDRRADMQRNAVIWANRRIQKNSESNG